MTATEIIREIQLLPLPEQEKVVRFAYQLDANRQLTGAELGTLARRMLEATDTVEKSVIRESIVRGFYGGSVGCQE